MDSYINRLKRRRRKRKVIRILFFTFTLIFIVFILGKSVSNPPSDTGQNQTKVSLQDVVKNALDGTKGTYGVVIKNLKTQEAYYSNEHRVYQAGSLYKLWVMATVYKQIQEGFLTEDQVLSEDIKTLNAKFNIDPKFAEQTEGTITLSIHDSLTQMITISHNYSALLLTERVKLSSVAKFLKDNGFNQSAVGTEGEDPTSTAFDIALFFEKLYKGELANEQYSKEMIDLLKNQQLNEGIPRYLPSSEQQVSVAHKTGDIEFFKHDGGIIFTDKGDYILVILSESDFPAAAQDKIAQLSKEIYDYFTK